MTPHELELLLADGGRLRRLARTLTDDPGWAEDLVQDTWLAALQSLGRRSSRGRSEPASRGGWLRAVLRNRWRSEGRAAARRTARERAVARAEALASQAEVAERRELEAAVLAAVRRLEEPYRSAIELRYLEGLPPRVVALRTGRDVRTVRTQLARGLQQLRARLERALGAEDARTRRRAPAVVPRTGILEALVMSTTAKLALATALAAIAALGYRATRSPAPLDPGLRAARAAQAPASAKPATPRGTRAPQARAGVAAPAAEELAPMAASGTAQASLSVRVVRAGDGARVSDAEVLVLAARDSEPLGRAGARVGAGDSDRDGRARIEVPPGHAFVVSVHPRASSSTPRDPLDVADVTIDALAPDEQRELTVALPHGLDGQFALRVVDAAGGAGIEGAEVRVRSTAGEELLQANGYGALRTDASGRLSFPWATWRPERLAIHAAGFGVAIVDQGSARPDATGEVVVPLRPAALVVVRVAPPEPGLEVRVACHDAALVQPAGEGLRGPLHWSAATDAAGAARLVDLPAGVRLQLSLWRGEDFLWGEPSALVLESGERRALSWTLDAGTRVEGYVLDPRGRGVADAEVWLVAQSPAEALGDCSRQFGEGDGGSAVQRASTDGSGRYLFAAVAPGSWWVGVGSATGAGPDGAARALTRPARRLVVARGDAGPATVTLNHEVDEGLFIHGVVLGTEGEPLDGLLVSGRRSGDCSDRTTRSSGGGRFRLGPLEPGRYFLHAFGGHGFLRTAGALAAAGSEDPVELRVRRGGEVTGRVLDASGGQGVDAHVTLTTPTGSLGMDTDQVPRGGFLFTGLGAGTFAVQAVTRDGRVGISEAISLTAERPDAEVEVVLGPSAFVELVLPADAAGGRAYLETADLRFVNRSIEPGDHVREAVPAGRVRVVMVTHVDGEWATVFDREVEVEAGTTRRVDLGER